MNNNLEGRGRGSSFRRSALTLVGASALTLSGVGAAVFGASQAFASSSPSIATSSPYVIGSGSIGNLSVSSSNNATTKTAVYTINFTATHGIGTSSTNAGDVVVAFSDATPLATQGSLTASGVTQPVTVAVSGNTATATLSSNVVAGSQVSLVFGNVTQGSPSTTANISVSTDQDTAAVTSSDYTISGTIPSSPTASASTSSLSANATWTLGSFGLFDSTASATPTLPSGSTLTLDISGATFAKSGTTSPSVATITDTKSSGTLVTSQTIPSATNAITPGQIVLTTTTALNVGDTINISITNVTNPSSSTQVTPSLFGTAPVVAGATSDNYEVVTEGTAAGSSPTPTPVPFPSVAIGTLSSVTGASISASPSVASTSTVFHKSTYTAGFTASTTGSKSDTIYLQLAPNTTFASTNEVIVTDNTLGVSNSTSSSSPVTTQVGSTANKLAIVSGLTITKGDSVTVQVFNVVNPTTTGALSGLISTTVDPGTVSASYSLTAATTTTSLMTVTLSGSSLAGASATYTITNLEATAAIASGDTVYIGAPTGTTFPSSRSDYSIQDLTTSSGSGAPAKVDTSATNPVTGWSAPVVVGLTLANGISAKDSLTVTITGVLNPPASPNNLMQVGNSFESATVPVTPAAPVAPVVTSAPNAASTMASGSLVQYGGTIYVISGGVAFGIPTYSDFVSISNGLGNPAVVQVSTAPSTVGTLASGTLVQVVGNPEVMVVGSNNTAYGFSTPSQFTSDGYSWSNVIQIPSLGNLTVGSAVAPSAASTMASGSLVQNGGTIYVIAGGVAFGIPTYSDFTTISAELGNPAVVQLSTAPSTTGTMASGTLVQMVGSPQVNVVTSTGTQVGFPTAAQFLSDGYSWSNVIMIP